VATVAEIDRLNVYRAALLAMRRAVEALPATPDHVLVDARNIPGVETPQNCFYKGDGINFSIAAASIIAKTHRDRLMNELAATHPEYGFERHKGYATPEHQDAIRRLGPSPIHRTSFAFLREICGEYSSSFYSLKDRLADARQPEALKAFEADLVDRLAELAEEEQRKLKLMVSRRWKTL
jgi:ribonuclease HII